jgi:hypothetical protein
MVALDYLRVFSRLRESMLATGAEIGRRDQVEPRLVPNLEFPLVPAQRSQAGASVRDRGRQHLGCTGSARAAVARCSCIHAAAAAFASSLSLLAPRPSAPCALDSQVHVIISPRLWCRASPRGSRAVPTRRLAGARSGLRSPTLAWTPHLTVCYSTGEQPAAPVIALLGKAIPRCEVTIDRLSLVVQNGTEQLWDWQVAGTARLDGHGSPGPGL